MEYNIIIYISTILLTTLILRQLKMKIYKEKVVKESISNYIFRVLKQSEVKFM